MVRVGSLRIRGPGKPLPRDRAQAKQALRDIAKGFGVNSVYFVKAKNVHYGGMYKPEYARIIVVEQIKSRKAPMYAVAFNLLHELVHHFQCREFLFAAYHYESLQSAKSGKVLKRYSLADARRVALRAERHADYKAVELAHEFFGMRLVPHIYPKEAVVKARADIFG